MTEEIKKNRVARKPRMKKVAADGKSLQTPPETTTVTEAFDCESGKNPVTATVKPGAEMNKEREEGSFGLTPPEMVNVPMVVDPLTEATPATAIVENPEQPVVVPPYEGRPDNAVEEGDDADPEVETPEVAPVPEIVDPVTEATPADETIETPDPETGVGSNPTLEEPVPPVVIPEEIPSEPVPAEPVRNGPKDKDKDKKPKKVKIRVTSHGNPWSSSGKLSFGQEVEVDASDADALVSAGLAEKI